MHAESDAQAIVETRLAHETHRLATGLLVDAVGRTSVPRQVLGQLRDFIVVNLRHHHETEDAWLWPLILAAAPDTKGALDQLSEEHAHLDRALDRLASVNLTNTEGPGGESLSGDSRHALREAAVAVRDSVRDHLAHEEPLLFPALQCITPVQWEEFAQRVIASTPPVAGHLMIGFLDEAGTPAEVESMLVNMPPPVKSLLPALRSQAAADLRALRGYGS
ncbi:hemerythrin domain-containing protein [Streptomyces sp. WAC05458]|nr:hemerythrin domain-containing protein [Streptomyces sp. KAI 90]RSS18250.1 hemerythrin domain-containing protein [Streptomyces sp. WAC05458]RSS98092.1 hemerythrin domain-containing protein [Streptomyces sp. WAC02707]